MDESITAGSSLLSVADNSTEQALDSYINQMLLLILK